VESGWEGGRAGHGKGRRCRCCACACACLACQAACLPGAALAGPLRLRTHPSACLPCLLCLYVPACLPCLLCLQAFIDKFRYNANRAALVQSRIKALERLAGRRPSGWAAGWVGGWVKVTDGRPGWCWGG
jgi:hypothetical protein